MQDFALRVIDKCIGGDGIDSVLHLKRQKGHVVTFTPTKKQRALKPNTDPRSRKFWMRKRLAGVLDDVGSHCLLELCIPKGYCD